MEITVPNKNIQTPLPELFGDFYSPMHILSYGKKWMISTGSRSIGKSTGWLIYLIWKYLKKGERFIYVRRTDDETRLTATTCCDSAAAILRESGYPVFSVHAKGGFFYLKREEDKKEEPEIIGMYIPLSLAYKYKSANFGDNRYTSILYDEFITLDSTRYLGSQKNILTEYIKLDEFLVTVDRKIGKARTNTTDVILLGNMSTYYNPIFMALGIDRYLNIEAKNINPKNKKWIVEQTRSVKATDDILLPEYEYSEIEDILSRYNNDNVAFYDNFNMVEKINKPMFGMCNFKYRDHVMGVYFFKNDPRIYISDKRTPLETFNLTTGEKINYALARSPRGMPFYKLVKDSFSEGRVRFSSRQCQKDIQNYLLLMPV